MANDIGGVWRTIGGRRVFIKDGQDLASAMKESGKFKSKKDIEHQQNSSLNEVEEYEESSAKEYNDTLKMIEKDPKRYKLIYQGEVKTNYSKEDVPITVKYVYYSTAPQWAGDTKDYDIVFNVLTPKGISCDKDSISRLYNIFDDAYGKFPKSSIKDNIKYVFE